MDSHSTDRYPTEGFVHSGPQQRRPTSVHVGEDAQGFGSFMETLLMVISVILIILTFPFSLCVVIKQVQVIKITMPCQDAPDGTVSLPVGKFLSFSLQEYQRAVIFRLGRVQKGEAVGPGLFFIIPCTDSIQVVDLRTVSFDVPPQEILTKDSVTVAVDAVVYGPNVRNLQEKINKLTKGACFLSDITKSKTPWHQLLMWKMPQHQPGCLPLQL